MNKLLKNAFEKLASLKETSMNSSYLIPLKLLDKLIKFQELSNLG